MELAVLALAGVIVIGGAFYAMAWLTDQRRQMQSELMNAQQAAEQRLAALDTRLNQRLDSLQGSLGQSMNAATETFGRINQQLGALAQSAERILAVGQDISALQDILQPPKLRGGFGEFLLERILEQVVPGVYSVQYRFRNGETVDAVVRYGDLLVPIDSKFPLESFNRVLAAESEDERRTLRREFERAVRGHIESVARYIRPDEGTLDFALMYIPAERVYYELTAGEGEEPGEFFAQAGARRVFPVSPATLYAYLASISIGLRGMRVEEEAREIIARLGRLGRDFDSFLSEFRVLGSHLENARRKYEALGLQAERLSERLALPIGPADPMESGRPPLLDVQGGSGGSTST